MFTLMVFANFSWYIIGELFNPIANDSQTIEWTLNNIYPHCIGWAKQSTITIRASHMQLFWIFILFRAVNTVKLNFNAGLFSSTFLFEHLLLAKSHLQFTWLALITISCIFLVVGPSSLSVAIFIQLGLSSNWMKGNDSLHYPSFNLRIPRQCQQNFEVNFILREWSSWMMERHFPFPYAAPQIYASPGCNAENSNFNMTERNLISRKFFFPFFLLNNSIWKFTEFVIKVLLPIGFLKSPTSIRTSREFVIANLFLESFSFHCKNIICMF